MTFLLSAKSRLNAKQNELFLKVIPHYQMLVIFSKQLNNAINDQLDNNMALISL
jgi:hypothetical protein